MDAYLFHLVVEACILSMLAASLNFMAGYGRLVSLGQMTFYAIGAYSIAILVPATQLGYFLAVPAGILFAVLVAVIAAIGTARLKNDEFAIATFALQIAFWTLLMNWQSLTDGPLGIGNIPPISIGAIALDTPISFLPVAIALLIVVLMLVFRTTRRPFGFLLHMFRDDEDLAQNFGRDTRKVRISLWTLSALIAAAAGMCQASYVGYINPASFSTLESTILLAVVILGGAGTFWGPVFGGFAMTLLPEAFRYIGLPSAQAANIRQMLLGAVLIFAAFRMLPKATGGSRLALGTRNG